MSNKLQTLDQVVSMTSLEIAELTGKRHDNVLVDCDKMMTELYGNGGVLRFQETLQNEQNGQAYRVFKLDKKHTLILVTGYNVKLRAAVIDRVEFLESQVKRLEDVQKRVAKASANRRGVTWGDFCKANGLQAQKMIKPFIQSNTVLRRRPNGEIVVNPKYAECFMVFKPTDKRFSDTGLNFRFTHKGMERFSSPNGKAFLIGHYMKLGNPTAKEYREWCQAKAMKLDS